MLPPPMLLLLRLLTMAPPVAATTARPLLRLLPWCVLVGSPLLSAGSKTAAERAPTDDALVVRDSLAWPVRWYVV